MENKCAIAPAVQLALLKRAFPGTKGNLTQGMMTWQGDFSPAALSDTYRLKLEYRQGGEPKAYIVSPKNLPLAEGATRLPHTYRNKERLQQLCLYLPGTGEWKPSMKLADTMVHWAVQWMYYYEIWVTTGKWLGGGHGNWDAKKRVEH